MESEQRQADKTKKPSEKRKKVVVVKKGKNIEKISKNDEKTETRVNHSKKRSRSEAKGRPDGESVLSTSDEATLKLLKHVGK